MNSSSRKTTSVAAGKPGCRKPGCCLLMVAAFFGVVSLYMRATSSVDTRANPIVDTTKTRAVKDIVDSIYAARDHCRTVYGDCYSEADLWHAKDLLQESFASGVSKKANELGVDIPETFKLVASLIDRVIELERLERKSALGPLTQSEYGDRKRIREELREHGFLKF